VSTVDRLLLDTHVAVWLREGQLNAAAEEIIADAGAAGGVFVSPLTAWEIGMLSRPSERRSTLRLAVDPLTWFEKLSSLSFIRQAPCTPAILVAASRLPGEVHGDPVDRLLIATARETNCHLMTRDRNIRAYADAGHVEVIVC
jgi:PIN domain nuclease of toxin-antitoxin system